MEIISHVNEVKNLTSSGRVDDLIRKAKISNIARLAKMLVDLFGIDEPFKNVGKYQGHEIEMYLKGLNGYLTFILSSERKNFDCSVKKAENPISKVIINVKEDEIIKILGKVIRSKANLFGILKLLKYIFPRKIVIKGSYVAAIKLTKCLMIGKHKIYKRAREE